MIARCVTIRLRPHIESIEYKIYASSSILIYFLRFIQIRAKRYLIAIAVLRSNFSAALRRRPATALKISLPKDAKICKSDPLRSSASNWRAKINFAACCCSAMLLRLETVLF